MTKKEVYKKIKNNPSYLKKGIKWIYKYWKINFSYLELEKLVKQARIDFNNSYLPKGYISSIDKYNDSNQVNKSLSKVEIFKQSNFKDTPWSKKLQSFKKEDYKYGVIIPSKKNVLVIADTHEPFCKEGYSEHCITIAKKYNCTEFVNIGDEVDLCGVSQWEKDPDGFSAGTEANLAQQKMKLWYTAFPNMKVCIGNHTARPFRQAKANGVPKKFIKSYEEAWEAPEGWKWAENWEIDNVLYTHGTGFSGANAAIRIATMHRQNTVIGHIHSEAGIQYNASKIDIIWGMQLGGALNDKSYAAYYAKDQLKKSIVGCGVVLEGKLPIYEPMNL